MTKKGEARRYFLEVVLRWDSDECLIWPYNKKKRSGKARRNDGVGAPGDASLFWSGKSRVVGRILCEMDHGAPPSSEHQAAHSCGRGHLGCVNRRHLAWKSPAENNADMISHGTRIVGEKNHKAKLTPDQVMEIRSMRGIVTQEKLAARFGITQATISKVQLSATWKSA